MFLRSAKFIVSPVRLLRLLLIVLAGLTAATAFPRAGHAATPQGEAVAVVVQATAASDAPALPAPDEIGDDYRSLGDDHADEVLILPVDAVDLQRMTSTRPVGADFIPLNAPLDDEPRPPDLG